MEYIAITISSLAAIAAILAPLLTARSNNKHNLKIKKIDAFFNHKFAIFQAFFEDYGVFVSNHQYLPNLQQVTKSASSVMLVVSENTRLEVKQLLNTLNTKHNNYYLDICNEQFEKCVTLICNELQLPQ